MLAPRIPFQLLSALALLACVCLLAAGTCAEARAQEQEAHLAAPNTPDEVMRGIELYNRGDIEGAITALRAATKRWKHNGEAWHYLGLALVKKEKFKDARRAFETAVQLRPSLPASLTGLAYALLRLNQTEEAARAAEKALTLNPASAEGHYILGIVYLRNNSNNSALQEAEAALKINPSFSPGLYLKILALIGMSGNAISAAADETPDVRSVLLEKVNTRLDEAGDALEKFQKLEPQNVEAASLGEQIKTLRVHRESFARSPSGREVLSAKEVTAKAKILRKPEPNYPPQARQNGTTGTVTLRLVLGADGTVKHIVALRRLPDGLTEAAIAAARGIKFIPATKGGRNVSQYATIQYNFNIYY